MQDVGRIDEEAQPTPEERRATLAYLLDRIAEHPDEYSSNSIRWACENAATLLRDGLPVPVPQKTACEGQTSFFGDG